MVNKKVARSRWWEIKYGVWVKVNTRVDRSGQVFGSRALRGVVGSEAGICPATKRQCTTSPSSRSFGHRDKS